MSDTELMADISQIKTAVKNTQKVIDNLSANLDLDRHDIAQIKIEMATMNSQIYNLSEQLATQGRKIAEKVADKTENMAQEVLESVAKKGKKVIIKHWWEVWKWKSKC